MTNKSKAIGTEWETRLVEYLRPRMGVAERLTIAGVNDQGDLWFPHGGHYYVVEAKAEKKIDLSAYVTEAEREAFHFAKARGIPEHLVHPMAIVKRRNYPVGKAYVVHTLDSYIREVKS